MRKHNPRMTKPRIQVTDADGLARNTKPAVLIVTISRKEIESGHYASALERLHVMTDTATNVLRYRQSMSFLVDGYNRDLRELPEIPEVRSFFKNLTAEWPHWFWFLSRGTGGIPLLMSLLCDVQVVRCEKGSYGTSFSSKKELQQAVDDLLVRGNTLLEAHKAPKDLVE